MNRRIALILLVAVGPFGTLPWIWSSWAQDVPGAIGNRKVIKTDDQWAKLLTVDQFLVLRRKATEPAFSGKYVHNHAKGTYACAGCGAELFSSTAKFESGTGWPSFFRPIDPRRLITAPDYSMAEPRVEVECHDCGGHLGHVFNDGPPPTGLRFCLNSLALKFRPGAAPKPEPTAKTKKGAAKTAKAKAKAGAPSKADDPTTQPSPGGPADPPRNDTPAPGPSATEGKSGDKGR